MSSGLPLGVGVCAHLGGSTRITAVASCYDRVAVKFRDPDAGLSDLAVFADRDALVRLRDAVTAGLADLDSCTTTHDVVPGSAA